MSIAAAFAELLRSPQLPAHLKQLEKLFKEEQARRGSFYEEASAGGGQAEFINGQVVALPPPSPEERAAAKALADSLRAHAAARGGGEVFTAGYFVRTARNDYLPDVAYLGPVGAGEFHAGREAFPPPDLIVEVTASATAGRDRGLKAEDYARQGVAEYWIIDPAEGMAEQYILPPDGEEFELLARVGAAGRLVSAAVAGWSWGIEPPG